MPGGISSGSAIGKKTFNRPPVTVIPASAGIGSAKFNSSCFSWVTGMSGDTARMRAAAPETCGVAMEVPSKDSY